MRTFTPSSLFCLPSLSFPLLLPGTIYLPPPTVSLLLVFSPISLGNGDKLKAEMLFESLTADKFFKTLVLARG